jgi:dolichol-phosphate mannosyltransferase
MSTGQRRIGTNALVIVPTYNECDNIQPLIHAIFQYAPDSNILIVDDASPDGTGDIVQSMSDTDERIHVLHRQGKLGLGSAYIAGFQYALSATYDYIVQMDADFSHRPSDVPRMLERARAFDLVIGSRNIPGGRVENWSKLRTCVSKGGSLYARSVLHLPIHDCTSGFKCFHRNVLNALRLDEVRSNGYAFQVEINYLVHIAGFQISEIPIVFPNRTTGSSKMTPGIAMEAARLVWHLRREHAQPVVAPTARVAPRPNP